MNKSWKTNLAAIAAFVGIVAAAVAAHFDQDPTTVADFSGVIQGLGTLLAALGIDAWHD